MKNTANITHQRQKTFCDSISTSLCSFLGFFFQPNSFYFWLGFRPQLAGSHVRPTVSKLPGVSGALFFDFFIYFVSLLRPPAADFGPRLWELKHGRIQAGDTGRRDGGGADA